MSNHFPFFSINKLLWKLLALLIVTQVFVIDWSKFVLNSLWSYLFLKTNCKDSILARLNNFWQLSHAAFDLFVEVVSTPHIPFNQIFAYYPGAAIVVLDSHSIPLNFINLKITNRWKVVINLKFLWVPKWFLIFINLSFRRVGATTFANLGPQYDWRIFNK